MKEDQIAAYLTALDKWACAIHKELSGSLSCFWVDAPPRLEDYRD